MIRAPGLLVTGWLASHHLQLILTSWHSEGHCPARGEEASSRPNRPVGAGHTNSSQCGAELAGNLAVQHPASRVSSRAGQAGVM